jgi:hypothetical protein
MSSPGPYRISAPQWSHAIVEILYEVERNKAIGGWYHQPDAWACRRIAAAPWFAPAGAPPCERTTSGPSLDSVSLCFRRMCGRAPIPSASASSPTSRAVSARPIQAVTMNPPHADGRHASGLPRTLAPQPCRGCAWATVHRAQLQCHAAAERGQPGPFLPADGLGCAFWEPQPDCADCGACCREAFDSVPVTDADLGRLQDHPELIRTHTDGWRDLQRVDCQGGTRCIALQGNGSPAAPYRCGHYALRPTNCRDLEVGSPNCLLARRRVGLSPDLTDPAPP